MATEDEHRLYALLAIINFDSQNTRAQLTELVSDRRLALKEAVADYRGDEGKPPGYRWSRLAEYAIEVFSGLSPTVDVALGALASPSPGAREIAAEAIGRRWRDDVLDTAWRIIVAERMAESPLPE